MGEAEIIGLILRFVDIQAILSDLVAMVVKYVDINGLVEAIQAM